MYRNVASNISERANYIESNLLSTGYLPYRTHLRAKGTIILRFPPMRKCSPQDINENGGELDDLVGVVHSVLLLARGFEVHYHQVVESSEFSTDYKRYCPKSPGYKERNLR